MVRRTGNRNQKQKDGGARPWSKRWLRILRRVLTVAVLALVGLAFLLMVVFLLAPTRTAVLGWGVKIADDALPGSLTAGQVNWPSVGHLVFDDVLWISGSTTAPGDTLADLARLDLTLDLGALRQRDGRVESLFLDVRHLDVPAIAEATADSSAGAIPDSLVPVSEPAAIPFLQPGSLPGMPSVAVNKMDLKVARARLAPDFSIRDLELSAWADAGPERPARLVINHAGARLVNAVRDTAGVQEWETVIEHLGLGVNLDFASRKAGDWTLATAALDSLNLVLAPAESRDPRDIWHSSEPVSLNAVASITRQGREYLGQFEGDFVLPGAAHFQPWLPPGFPHEEFGAVAGHIVVDGNYTAPQFTGKLRLDLGSSTWLDQGVIVGGAEADINALKAHGARELTAHLDTFDIALEGVRVKSFGNWKSGDFDLGLTTSLTDFRLIGLFVTGLDPTLGDFLRDPGPVSLNADAAVGRNGAELSGRLDCDFSLPGSSRFERWLPEDFPHEDFESLIGNLNVAGNWTDPVAKGSVRLDLGENSWAEKGLASGNAEANLDSLKNGGLRFLTARLDTVDLALEDLRIQASGEWRSGDFDLDLITSLTDFQLIRPFTSGMNPDLDDLLRDPGPVSLNAEATLGRMGAEFSGRLDGDFALPGASHFERWLPEEFPVEDFESLVGNFAVAGNWADPVAKGTVLLDLGENAWAEKGLLSGGAEANLDSLKIGGLRYLTARLDKLEVAMEGIRVQASGGLNPQSVDLDLQGEVTDFLIPGMFAGPDLADVELDIQIDATVTGSLDDPEIDAQAEGSFVQERISIPSFDFTIEGDRKNVAARLAAGGGLHFEGTSLDSVRAQVQGELAGLDSLTASFGLAVWREKGHLALGGAVSGDTVRVVRLDSLVTRHSGKELRTKGPATLTLGPGPYVFDLTQLELAGDPGSVNLRGFWNESNRDIDGDIDLLVSEELLQEFLPSELWSLNGGVDLKLDATSDLEGGENDTRLAGRASAVLMPHRDEPPFGVGMEFTSTGGAEAVLNADFVLSSADTSLLKAQLVWPGRAGPEAGFWNPDPERDLVLTVPSQRLDLSRINSRLPAEIVLDGKFDIAAEVHVFPPDKGRTEAGPPLPQGPRGSVDGTLGSPDLHIDLPNRSYLNTVFNATASGSLADPKVDARFEVKSGFIRIPEIPRNLHQVEGVSLLWALNDSLEALADTTVADGLWDVPARGNQDSLLVFLRPEQIGPALEPSGPPFLPDLDVDVVISDKLRIIGYGADIKLGGKLKVGRGYDEDNIPGPAIKGNINIPEGTIKVMNRVFKVERGNIKFTESVPANPNLDLMMETQVNAYLLRVLVSGKSAAPVIELTSEPDLSEEDVMAVLLFGQPMSDLDGDQRGRMQEENDPSRELQKNLAGLAMAFGTRGLQDSMSDSFGVDVVSMGSDSAGGSTLMVGKFITPDILLKYNQSLENSGTYFMTLEYSLNRYFKIVSTYGQGEEASGAEVKWSRRY